MTVSTINGVQAELRRVQDSQNKPEKSLPLQPSGASLPEDVINIPSEPVAAGPSVAQAIQLSKAQNLEAAASTLSDADLDAIQDSTRSSSEQVQSQVKAATAAQTNKLPGDLLALLSE